MALRVVDRAIQVHGAEGISQDTPLAYFYATLRTLRFADVSPQGIREAMLSTRGLMKYIYSKSANKSLRKWKCSGERSKM